MDGFPGIPGLCIQKTSMRIWIPRKISLDGYPETSLPDTHAQVWTVSLFLTDLPFYACSFTSMTGKYYKSPRHQGLLLSLQDIPPINIASCQFSPQIISSASGFCSSRRNLVIRELEIIMISVLII